MRIYIPVKYEELFKNFLDYAQMNLADEELDDEEREFVVFVRTKLLENDYSGKPKNNAENPENSKEISILFDNKKEN